MRIFTKKRGFSIVEEIVSIAIIMLIAIVILNSLATYTKLVYKSGNTTKNVSEAQNKLGNAIQNTSTMDVTKISQTMSLNLGALGTKLIPGTTITYIDHTGKNKTNLSTFVAN